MKKIYIDFEMNMANTKTKKDMLDADIIAIGAIKYDTDTGEIEKFKSLIKPITNLNIFPHIQELTNISQEDISKAPSYETVMRKFKKWLGELYQIEGIYTFGNLDLMCFNNTDKKSSTKYNHPRFVNNIKNLFVDIKDKYINYGIRCINYVSLKNLLDCANVEFYGDAHDPLYDAYNLFILDKTLENSEETRNILMIKDIVRPPFTVINENLEYIFEEYRISLYGNNSDEIHKDISIEILKTIRIYIESIKQIDIYNIEILRDINRKLEVINNLKDLKVGYFFLLENLYFDMKDLFDDLMLYKVTTTEYKEEIENIILSFNEDLLYEGIDVEYILEESC